MRRNNQTSSSASGHRDNKESARAYTDDLSFELSSIQRRAASVYLALVWAGKLRPAQLIESAAQYSETANFKNAYVREPYLDGRMGSVTHFMTRIIGEVESSLVGVKGPILLRLDNGPQGLLSEAIDRVGIPKESFPLGELNIAFDSYGHIIVGDERISARDFVHEHDPSFLQKIEASPQVQQSQAKQVVRDQPRRVVPPSFSPAPTLPRESDSLKSSEMKRIAVCKKVVREVFPEGNSKNIIIEFREEAAFAPEEGTCKSEGTPRIFVFTPAQARAIVEIIEEREAELRPQNIAAASAFNIDAFVRKLQDPNYVMTEAELDLAVLHASSAAREDRAAYASARIAGIFAKRTEEESSAIKDKLLGILPFITRKEASRDTKYLTELVATALRVEPDKISTTERFEEAVLNHALSLDNTGEICKSISPADTEVAGNASYTVNGDEIWITYEGLGPEKLREVAQTYNSYYFDLNATVFSVPQKPHIDFESLTDEEVDELIRESAGQSPAAASQSPAASQSSRCTLRMSFWRFQTQVLPVIAGILTKPSKKLPAPVPKRPTDALTRQVAEALCLKSEVVAHSEIFEKTVLQHALWLDEGRGRCKNITKSRVNTVARRATYEVRDGEVWISYKSLTLREVEEVAQVYASYYPEAHPRVNVSDGSPDSYKRPGANYPILKMPLVPFCQKILPAMRSLDQRPKEKCNAERPLAAATFRC